MLYGTSTRHLKGLTELEQLQLNRLSWNYRALYNHSLVLIQQQIELHGSPPTFAALMFTLEQEPVYQALGHPFRHAVGQALDNVKISIQKAASMPRQYSRPMAVVLRDITIKQGKVLVPASRDTGAMWLPIPTFDLGHDIFRVILLATDGGIEWTIYTNRRMESPPMVPLGETVGIDLGISNFAALACSNGNTLIVDGRRLKSIYQKEYKRQYEEGDTQFVSQRFQDCVNDYVCKAAAFILEFCQANHVGKVLVGKGDVNSKERIKWRIHKLYPDYPYTRLKTRIFSKCQQAGIRILEVDESWTSKASFIDDDVIPMYYNRRVPQFSGVRQKRGLYISKEKHIINADINGALNILRKHNACPLRHLQENPRLIKSPRRIDPLSCKPNSLWA